IRNTLGRPSHSIVGQFQAPNWVAKELGDFMAVKIAAEGKSKDPILNEIEVLRSISAELKELNNIDDFRSLPFLVHEKTDNPEFGIMPVGEQFRVSKLPSQEAFVGCMLDVLDALDFIHKLGIIHRDVRVDNIVLLPVHDEIERTRKFGNSSTKIGKAVSTIRPRAVLIDFDHAVEANTKTIYEG